MVQTAFISCMCVDSRILVFLFLGFSRKGLFGRYARMKMAFKCFPAKVVQLQCELRTLQPLVVLLQPLLCWPQPLLCTPNLLLCRPIPVVSVPQPLVECATTFLLCQRQPVMLRCPDLCRACGNLCCADPNSLGVRIPSLTLCRPITCG